MLSFPFVNGQVYDFSSVTLHINGTPFRSVKSIDYSQALEPGEERGTDAIALGRTRGQYKPEASIEIWREVVPDLLELLGDGFGETVFDVDVQFQEDGQTMQDVYLPSVRIKKDSASMSNGSDALSVKYDLHLILPIKVNGKSMVRSRNAIGVAAGVSVGLSLIQ